MLEEYPDTILTDPSDDLINAMNELIEIIALCSKCLLKFSPKLLNMICDIEYETGKWIPFIEVLFGMPQINSTDNFQQLNFGTVLSVISLFVKILNLQHYSFKHQPLNSLPNENEVDDHETVSMLSMSEASHQRALDNSPPRQFTRSITTTSMTSSMVQASNELLSRLDSKVCLVALELTLTLLASQSLLALKNQDLSSRDKQMIRRDLSNELHCFHDFVKKKIVNFSAKDAGIDDPTKSVLYRKKFGSFSIMNQTNNETLPSTSSKSVPKRLELDLRKNVVRKMHLQSTFDVSGNLSPISSRHHQGETTPMRSSQPTSSTAIKRVGFDNSEIEKVMVFEDDEPFVVNPGDPSFTGLSIVKMVEEDYLHLLSNLFLFICQFEN